MQSRALPSAPTTDSGPLQQALEISTQECENWREAANVYRDEAERVMTAGDGALAQLSRVPLEVQASAAAREPERHDIFSPQRPSTQELFSF